MATNRPGGGQRLGVAQGRIAIDLSALQRSRQIAVSASQQIGDSIKRNFNAGTSAVHGLGKQLDSLSARIKKVRGEIATVSGASAGFALLGVRAADNLKQVEIRFRALTGSQQKATQLMQLLERAAKRFALPVTETQAAMSGLVASLPDGTKNLEKWTELVARLSTLNKSEGTAGAVFAIREALSSGGTDLVSLSERFNIPRKRLRELIAETGNFADALDIALNEMGATTIAAEEMGRTASAAAARAGDAFNRAAGTALEPFLNTIADAADRAAEFFNNLRESNPVVLQIAGGLSLAVAAGGALIVTFGQIISSLRTIQNVAPGALGTLGRVGAVGLAVGAGVEIGKFGARVLAASGAESGDLGRIRAGEDPSKILAERLNQIVVILADALIGLARIVAQAGAWLFNAVDQVLNVFRLLGAGIGTFIGVLQTGIGNIQVGLADFLSGIMDTTEMRNAGLFNRTQGEQRTFDSATEGERLARRLAEGFQLPQETINDINQRFDTFRESALGALTAILFPAEEAAEATEELTESLEGFNQAAGETAEFLEQQGKELVSASKSYTEDVKQINERANEQRAAIEERYADRLIEIAEQAADASEKALERLNERRAELFRDLARDEEAAARDQAFRELQDQIKAQEDEAKSYRDHQRKLEDIRREAQEKEGDLIASRDFAGLFKLRRDTSRELDDANRDFQVQQQERQIARQQELAADRRHYEQQRNERLIRFQQDLMDAQAAYLAEHQQIEAQRLESLAQARVARIQELTELRDKTRRELEMRRAGFIAELELIRQGGEQRLAIERQYLQASIAQARALLGSAGAFSGLSGGTGHVVSPGALPVGANRAFGGQLMAGQSSIVNDAYRGQRESFISGSRRATFPDALGVFMPLRAGRVDAGNKTGGGVVLNQTNQITGNNPDQIAELIDRRTVRLLESYFAT